MLSPSPTQQSQLTTESAYSDDLEFEEVDDDEWYVTRRIKKFCSESKDGCIIVGCPLLLLIVFIIVRYAAKIVITGRLFVPLLMTIYWYFEVMPKACVSLFPLLLFPLFHLCPFDSIVKMYFSAGTFEIFTISMVTITLARWNFYRRIVFFVLYITGTRPLMLIFTTMSIAWLMTMFITQDHVIVLLHPFMTALCEEFAGHNRECHASSEVAFSDKVRTVTPRMRRRKERKREKMEERNLKFKKAIFFCVAYSNAVAKICALNLYLNRSPLVYFFKKAWDIEFLPTYYSYFQVNWSIGLALSSIALALTLWIWIVFYFFGMKEIIHFDTSLTMKKGTMKFKMKDIPMSFAGVSSLLIYLFLILLYFTAYQHYGFGDAIGGWVSFFKFENLEDDMSIFESSGLILPSVIASFLVFIWPNDFSLPWKKKKEDREEDTRKRLRLYGFVPQEETTTQSTLMDWAYFKSHFNWELIFIMGSREAIIKILSLGDSEIRKYLARGFIEEKETKSRWTELISILIMELVYVTPVNQDAIAERYRCEKISTLIHLVAAEHLQFLLPIMNQDLTYCFAQEFITMSDILKVGCVSKILTLLLMLFSAYISRSSAAVKIDILNQKTMLPFRNCTQFLKVPT